MKKNVAILTAVLVLGGQAQAVTTNGLIDGAVEGVKSVDVTLDKLLNPQSLLNEYVNKIAFSGPKTIIAAGIGDLLLSMKTTNDASDKIQDVISPNSNVASGASGIFNRSNDALSTVLSAPFNPGNIANLGTAIATDSENLNKYLNMNTSQTPKNQSLGDNSGQKLANSVFTSSLENQKKVAMKTAIYQAQGEDLVTQATNEEAQKLNKAMDDQVKAASTQLSQDTKDAVSTRAVVQSLNTAFASYMVQDQFGQGQIQARLNLMLKQGALTNTQLGDIVGEMRKAEVEATEQQRRQVFDQQVAATQAITTFKKQSDAITLALGGAANNAEGSASDVTFNKPGQNPVPAPKTSNLPPDPSLVTLNSPAPTQP